MATATTIKITASNTIGDGHTSHQPLAVPIVLVFDAERDRLHVLRVAIDG
jgi:hypothetical protein